MAYTKTIWANAPATTSPINQINLNNMETGIFNNDAAITIEATNVDLLQTGWNSAGETWTYSSVDDPTGVITISGDKTTKYSLGMRIKFTNATNVIYGIITAISYSSPNTTLTFLHQIDPTDSLALYLMANSAITANYYSNMKAPFGFPLSIDKWSIRVSITAAAQANPTQNQIYNLANHLITVPIGSWNLGWKSNNYSVRADSGLNAQTTGLSTANNSFSDDDLTLVSFGQNLIASMTPVNLYKKPINLASKTVYYLNLRTSYTGLTSIGFYLYPVIIKAECLYL